MRFSRASTSDLGKHILDDLFATWESPSAVALERDAIRFLSVIAADRQSKNARDELINAIACAVTLRRHRSANAMPLLITLSWI